MYGLDADLIMLSLVTHEPHFCLLREVVKFGGGNAGQPSREVLENPSEEGFQLLQARTACALKSRRSSVAGTSVFVRADQPPCPCVEQIALLRDYLDAEFKPASSASTAKGSKTVKDSALLPFGYDLERIIDDFVFLAMLVSSPSVCCPAFATSACLLDQTCRVHTPPGGQRFFATAAHAGHCRGSAEQLVRDLQGGAANNGRLPHQRGRF